MIKPNELRIGNLVNVDNPKYHPKLKGVVLCVTGINQTKGHDNENTHSVSLEHINQHPNRFYETYSQFIEYISPITLTEDWCDKLFKETNGFSHCKIWTLGEGFKLAMHKDHRDFSILHEKVSPPSWTIIREVLYLHQLQNIVYFNTGTELTIKETV